MAMKVKVGSNESNDIKYKSNPNATAAEVKQITIDGTIKYAKNYTITFTAPDYGYWDSATKEAFFGDTLEASGKVITCKEFGTSQVRWTNEVHANSTTNQYTFSVGNASVTSGTSPVSGDVTIPKPTSGRTERSYNVSFSTSLNPTVDEPYAAWEPNSNAITATYSTAISKSDNVVTVGSTSKTFSVAATSDKYSYTYSISNASGTVGTGKTITGSATRTLRSYTVSITKGTGVSSVYLSSSSSATSGSETSFGYDTTVYGFAVLSKYYNAAKGWTKVSGTANSEGAIYRVGSKTVGTNTSFGTINAVRKTVTFKISKGTGVSKAYYREGTSGGWTEYTAGDTGITVNAGSTYQWYRTPSKHYHCTTDAQTATIELADVTVNATATINSYALSGGFTYGSVAWYSNSNHTSAISSAEYGSTVYYALNGNTGYDNGASGSIDLNDTNFTIANGAAAPADGSTAYHNFGTATNSAYTLTISVTGDSYGSYSVTRTPSKAGAPAESTVANGGTIYYGDTLTCSAEAAGSRYTDWDCVPGDLTVPTGSFVTGDAKTATIALTAQNSATANLYRYKDAIWQNGTTLLNDWGTSSTGSYDDTGLAFDTKYFYHVARNQNRTRYDRSVTNSGTLSGSYSGTAGVTGNVTATFAFAEDGGNAEANWIGDSPSWVEIDTGSRNSYTVTWKNHDGTVLETDTGVYWGETPTYNGNTPTKSSTAQYSYSHNGWSPAVGEITGDTIYTATFSANLRSYTYSTGTLPTGFSALTCHRASSPYAGASTGEIADGATIWYGDTLYWTYTLSDTNIYEIVCNSYYDADHTYEVTGNVTGVSATSLSCQVKRWTLTISTANDSYLGTYSVSRTSSDYGGGGTGALSNGATIYAGDVLTTSYTDKGSTYTEWSFNWSDSNPTVDNNLVCSASWDGGEATSCSITVTNSGNQGANWYYMRTSDADWTYGGWLNSGASTTFSCSWSTAYNFHVGTSRTRTRTDYSTTVTVPNGQLNGVNSATTVKFTGGASTEGESQWCWSNVPSVTTGSRTSYTIYFYNDTYGYWNYSSQTAYWGEYIYCYNGGDYCVLWTGSSYNAGGTKWTTYVSADTSYKGASAWCSSSYSQQVTGTMYIYCSSSATYYDVRYNPYTSTTYITHSGGDTRFYPRTNQTFSINLGTFKGRHTTGYSYTCSISTYTTYFGGTNSFIHMNTVQSNKKWTATLDLPASYYGNTDCYYSGTETKVSSCTCSSTGSVSTHCSPNTCSKNAGFCVAGAVGGISSCTTAARMGMW